MRIGSDMLPNMNAKTLLRLGTLCSAPILLTLGCGPKDSYLKTEVGPHGQIVSQKRVQLSPEQQASRNEAFGYGAPTEPTLVELEAMWPKLTTEQRASLLETAKQMSTPK